MASSPTRTEKRATIISSAVGAAWANCALYWIASTRMDGVSSGPSEYCRSTRASFISPWMRACSIGENVRSGRAVGLLPPSIRFTQPSAAPVGSWMTPRGSTSAMEQSTIAVLEGRAAAYSSYVCIVTCSHVTCESTRTFAVSCVPHCRAKVP